MKKTKYTKKQISEAIKYWQNQLKKMNESSKVKDVENFIRKINQDKQNPYVSSRWRSISQPSDLEIVVSDPSDTGLKYFKIDEIGVVNLNGKMYLHMTKSTSEMPVYKVNDENYRQILEQMKSSRELQTLICMSAFNDLLRFCPLLAGNRNFTLTENLGLEYAQNSYHNRFEIIPDINSVRLNDNLNSISLDIQIQTDANTVDKTIQIAIYDMQALIKSLVDNGSLSEDGSYDADKILNSSPIDGIDERVNRSSLGSFIEHDLTELIR